MIANVSLEPFAEKNFNPQSFRTLIPMQSQSNEDNDLTSLQNFMITIITKQTLKHKHLQ